MLPGISDEACSYSTTRSCPLLFLCARPSEACAILPNKPDYAQKIFLFSRCAPGHRRMTRLVRCGELGLARRCFHREMPLSSIAWKSSRRRRSITFGSLRQLHPHELADAPLFHGQSVDAVGLGNGGFVMRDNDELALG